MAIFFRSANRKLRSPAAAQQALPGSTLRGTGPAPIGADSLLFKTDPASLGISTSDDLDSPSASFGQERAVAALKLALGLRGTRRHIFVIGEPGLGAKEIVRPLIADHVVERSRTSKDLQDWVYVSDFRSPSVPRAMTLPAGRARELARDVERAVTELFVTLPAAYQRDDFKARQYVLDSEFGGQRDKAIADLERKSLSQNVVILRTPTGYVMAPMHDGSVVRPELFHELPHTMRSDIEKRIAALQTELTEILAASPAHERLHWQKTAALQEDVARDVVKGTLQSVKSAFEDVAAVSRYLSQLEDFLAAHATLFLAAMSKAASSMPQGTRSAFDPQFRDCFVTVAVSHDGPDASPPVHEVAAYSAPLFAGEVAATGAEMRQAASLQWMAPGALHAATGGYLLVDAEVLLSSPSARRALKFALEHNRVPVVQRRFGAPDVSQTGHEPEACTIFDCQVIVFGDPRHHDTLDRTDPDLMRCLEIKVRLEDTIEYSDESCRGFTSMLAAITRGRALKPCDTGAVGCVIDEARRKTGCRQEISIDRDFVHALLEEAEFYSADEARKTTTRDDVMQALLQRREREKPCLKGDQGQSTPEPSGSGDSGGAVQVTSMASIGPQRSPSGRMTTLAPVRAFVAPGLGAACDIVRLTAVAGHAANRKEKRTSCGPQYLESYLASKFAAVRPLTLTALIETGSADEEPLEETGLAEACAVMSALADLPLKQSFGVFGALGPDGNVRPVDRLNECVEWFFDASSASRSPDRMPGVLVPKGMIDRLMLRDDIIASVRQGTFLIYPVATVDEVMGILTGLEAGQVDEEGNYPGESINGRAQARLISFTKALNREAIVEEKVRSKNGRALQ